MYSQQQDIAKKRYYERLGLSMTPHHPNGRGGVARSLPSFAFQEKLSRRNNQGDNSSSSTNHSPNQQNSTASSSKQSFRQQRSTTTPLSHLNQPVQLTRSQLAKRNASAQQEEVDFCAMSLPSWLPPQLQTNKSSNQNHQNDHQNCSHQNSTKNHQNSVQLTRSQLAKCNASAQQEEVDFCAMSLPSWLPPQLQTNKSSNQNRSHQNHHQNSSHQNHQNSTKNIQQKSAPIAIDRQDEQQTSFVQKTFVPPHLLFNFDDDGFETLQQS
mmetsp:Transcript_17762/g.26444  ORF Transcript_17762/g.26444 Transcript_17762/m.26444 type:complete len:268 (-) Transcript_17762:73-876(-)